MELRGASQVGKTYILDKFSRENYKIFIHINMAQTSGREFLDCLKAATDWEPGTPRRNRPLHEAYSTGFFRTRRIRWLRSEPPQVLGH